MEHKIIKEDEKGVSPTRKDGRLVYSLDGFDVRVGDALIIPVDNLSKCAMYQDIKGTGANELLAVVHEREWIEPYFELKFLKDGDCIEEFTETTGYEFVRYMIFRGAKLTPNSSSTRSAI